MLSVTSMESNHRLCWESTKFIDQWRIFVKVFALEKISISKKKHSIEKKKSIVVSFGELKISNSIEIFFWSLVQMRKDCEQELTQWTNTSAEDLSLLHREFLAENDQISWSEWRKTQTETDNDRKRNSLKASMVPLISESVTKKVILYDLNRKDFRSNGKIESPIWRDQCSETSCSTRSHRLISRFLTDGSICTLKLNILKKKSEFLLLDSLNDFLEEKISFDREIQFCKRHHINATLFSLHRKHTRYRSLVDILLYIYLVLYHVLCTCVARLC